jgi:anti-sigma B factor antagonist
MEVTVREQDGVQVMSMTGRLDATTAPPVQARFEEVVSPQERLFILDLHGVDYVSSGGLRVLLAMAKKLDTLGGGIVLVDLHPFVEDLLTMTGFQTLFPIADTCDDAMRMLSEGGAR